MTKSSLTNFRYVDDWRQEEEVTRTLLMDIFHLAGFVLVLGDILILILS